MEITGKKILLNETMVDLSGEKTIEGEIIVPDYRSDVLKIIRTEATPRIVAKRKNQDRLIIEGVVDIRIFYWPDKENGMRTLYHCESFTQEFELKDAENAVFVRAMCKTEYVNGSIINSRKLSYKTVVSTAVKVYYKRDAMVMLAEQTDSMEACFDTIDVCEIAAAGEKNIVVSDIIEISAAKSEIKEIIKCEGAMFTGELKSINNKIITRGRADMKILYLSVEDKIETVMAEIPFTQIIDIDGIDEDCVTDLKYCINNITAASRENENGEARQICVDIDGTAQARGYKNIRYNVTRDAYSTRYSCRCDKKEISMEKLETHHCQNYSDKGVIESKELIRSVSDLSATAVVTSVAREAGAIRLNCSVSCNVIAEAEDMVPYSLAKQLDTELRLPVDDSYDQIRIEPDLVVSGISYSISGDRNIDIKYDLLLDALVFVGIRSEVVTSVSMDEEQTIERADAPMVIYYAKRGDRVWDIAKEYKTSQRAICEANSIDTAVLPEDKTIIIPIMKV